MLICYRPHCIITGKHVSHQRQFNQSTNGTTKYWLNHIGADNLYRTLHLHFAYPGLKEAGAEFVKDCTVCQQHKLPGRGYGHLPPREAQLKPFYDCCVDLIGPWNVTLNGEVLSISALTCIDPVTNLTELVRLQNRTSSHVAFKFEQAWLSRYPRPVQCIHDQGTEFTGAPFQQLLDLFGIKDVPTSVANPQANSVCERMHQVVGNLLRTLIHSTTRSATTSGKYDRLRTSNSATFTSGYHTQHHGNFTRGPRVS